MKSHIHNLRAPLLLLGALALVVLAGCGPVKLVANTNIPTPLVVKIPIAVALFVPKEFSTYVHNEERWSTDWHVELGKAQTDGITRLMNAMFERVIIASGTSNTQVKALADRVEERIKENGARVYGVEGQSAGEWVLVDLGDVVVHIMHPTVREFYNLEEIWGGKPVRMKAETKVVKKKAKPRAKAPRRRAKR